jgi:biopolymer transport protein ExbD
MALSRTHKDESEPKVEINIVPLVDVSLVLLIIFMVTATFIRAAGMHIRLPTSSMGRTSGQIREEIVVGIDAGGRYLWKGCAISDDSLAAALRHEARRCGTDTRVTVQGDMRATHGRVVGAMTMAQEAGFSRLVIATRKEVLNDVR